MKKYLLSLAALVGLSTAAFAQTAEKPYTVQEVIDLGTAGSEDDVYVEGYIVGYIPDKTFADAIFSATGSVVETNIVLADAASEDSYQMCIPVQLPSGTVRNALNLALHPENLGHKVLLKGQRIKYFGAPGMKSVTSYSWVGEAPVPSIPDAIGSKEAPVTVTDLLASAPNRGGATWVKGFVVGYVDGMTISTGAVFSADNASATNILLAANAADKDYTLCLPVQLPADVRADLSLANNPSLLGKEVVLYGTNEKYFGATGLKNVTGYIIDGVESGNTGGNTGSGAIYDKALTSSDNGFTFENNECNDGANYVWSVSDKYGLVASSYVSGTAYESDSYAVSPVLDLTDYVEITMNFKQAANKFNGTFLDHCNVAVREENGAWEELPGLSNHEDSWQFLAVEPFDLSKWAGKKIQVGFHYTATATECGTWEIDSLVIDGKKNTAVAGIDAEEGEAIYFNLQGVKVANPENGLFIKVQGKKATKVVIR